MEGNPNSVGANPQADCAYSLFSIQEFWLQRCLVRVVYRIDTTVDKAMQDGD